MNPTAILLVAASSAVVTAGLMGLIWLLIRTMRSGGGGGVRRATPAAQLFTINRARLTCDGGSLVKVGQPCRITFQWGIMNGARSLVIHRTKLLVQKDNASFHPVCSVPELDQRKAASYERTITGDITRVFAWEQPGIFYLKARVKASLAGSPFTYQFEVRGRVRVMPADAVIQPLPQEVPTPPTDQETRS